MKIHFSYTPGACGSGESEESVKYCTCACLPACLCYKHHLSYLHSPFQQCHLQQRPAVLPGPKHEESAEPPGYSQVRTLCCVLVNCKSTCGFLSSTENIIEEYRNILYSVEYIIEVRDVVEANLI